MIKAKIEAIIQKANAGLINNEDAGTQIATVLAECIDNLGADLTAIRTAVERLVVIASRKNGIF